MFISYFSFIFIHYAQTLNVSLKAKSLFTTMNTYVYKHKHNAIWYLFMMCNHYINYISII